MARDKAALASRGRRAKILKLLAQHGPLALFEPAALMDVHDHQISGRITDVRNDGLIEATRERGVKPETGCPDEFYRLRAPIR